MQQHARRSVRVLVVTLVALATLAFGAVYPWAYPPLFAAAALIGTVTWQTAESLLQCVQLPSVC